jgi:DNA-directed RNA polymerase subunit beta'
MTRKVVTDAKGTTLKPAIEIMGEGDKRQVRYGLPVGAILSTEDNAVVAPGDIIAKIPRETTKTKDITGGLPRVAELFEARKPKDMAINADRDGTIEFGADTKGKRKLTIVGVDGEKTDYAIQKGRHVIVTEGD